MRDVISDEVLAVTTAFACKTAEKSVGVVGSDRADKTGGDLGIMARALGIHRHEGESDLGFCRRLHARLTSELDQLGACQGRSSAPVLRHRLGSSRRVLM